MNSTSAVNLPESHSDYECFVSDIRKDFDLRVETVQKSAEENTRAYEAYCSELKSQLQESLAANKRLDESCAQLKHQLAQSRAENKRLEDRLTETREQESPATRLLSAMTCLTVTHTERVGNRVIYTCVVDDGRVKGHEFTLSLDESSWEYTYKPGAFIAASTGAFNLNSIVCFPDYMISRFLINLLEITYS